MSDKARTVSERAVRKASRERLLADMRAAAADLHYFQSLDGMSPDGTYGPADDMLFSAQFATSRTRYACLMTAFGQ